MTFSWLHAFLLIIPILPNLWSIRDVWNHSFKDYSVKITWLAIAVFLPVIGGLLYIFIGRRQALPLGSQSGSPAGADKPEN